MITIRFNEEICQREQTVCSFCRTAGFLALKVKNSYFSELKTHTRQTSVGGVFVCYINESMSLNVTVHTLTNKMDKEIEREREIALCSKCLLLSWQESEPRWRALGLKLKRALTWHSLVSNCCLLSLINNGAEFELLQIRTVNLHSPSPPLTTSCTASVFVDPQNPCDNLTIFVLHFSFSCRNKCLSLT